MNSQASNINNENMRIFLYSVDIYYYSKYNAKREWEI